MFLIWSFEFMKYISKSYYLSFGTATRTYSTPETSFRTLINGDVLSKTCIHKPIDSLNVFSNPWQLTAPIHRSIACIYKHRWTWFHSARLFYVPLLIPANWQLWPSEPPPIIPESISGSSFIWIKQFALCQLLKGFSTLPRTMPVILLLSIITT